jgi:hypothetical protein
MKKQLVEERPVLQSLLNWKIQAYYYKNYHASGKHALKKTV